jgi:acyl carrier protein
VPNQPSADDFLAVLEDAYETAKGLRRTVRMQDDIARDLEFDSLDTIELFHVLEQKYDAELIDVPGPANRRTVGDLYELVTGRPTG